MKEKPESAVRLRAGSASGPLAPVTAKSHRQLGPSSPLPYHRHVGRWRRCGSFVAALLARAALQAGSKVLEGSDVDVLPTAVATGVGDAHGDAEMTTHRGPASSSMPGIDLGLGIIGASSAADPETGAA